MKIDLTPQKIAAIARSEAGKLPAFLKNAHTAAVNEKNKVMPPNPKWQGRNLGQQLVRDVKQVIQKKK
jgi:cytochrome c551/c552